MISHALHVGVAVAILAMDVAKLITGETVYILSADRPHTRR